MERIGILGGSTLIGQHLMSALSSYNAKAVLVWDEFDSVCIESNNNEMEMSFFTGLDGLDDIINNSDVIFNLYEAQDFSLIPHDKTLQWKNVDFVKMLIDKCETANMRKLVHLSTIYVQSSTRWPNIYGREELDYNKFRNEVPFPAYCESKHKAEQLLLSAGEKLQSVCARVGAVYGEGDRKSIVCDALYFSKRLTALPRIGDTSGTIQLTYAGNVANALLKCAEKLFEDANIRHEVVLVHDDTPVTNVYETILLPLSNNNGESIAENNNDESYEQKSNFLKISDTFISFYLFFPLYWSFCLLAWCWAMLFSRNSVVSKLPSPYYPYMVIHQWTFYSDFKLRIFFNCKPKFDYETSLKRSRQYYQSLDVEEIENFSWLP